MKKLMIFFVIVLISSCSYDTHFTKGKVVISKKSKIGILLFSNLSTYPNAEFLVTDSITTSLSKLPLTLIDSGSIAKYYNIYRSVSYNDIEKIKTISEKADLDYLVAGYVEEFGYRQAVFGYNEAPVVSFTVYVYNMDTIRPVFQGTYTKSNLKNSSGEEDGLFNLLEEVSECFLKDLAK